MNVRGCFSGCSLQGKTLTGKVARCVSLGILLLLLLTTASLRIYSFVLTYRFQKVISGLSKLRIDHSTEAEVIRTVPCLKRSEWARQVNPNSEVGNVDKGVEQFYSIAISNEPSWMRFETFAERFSKVLYLKTGEQKSWIFTAADWLGFRYVYLGADVVLLNGTVSSIGYIISDELVFPRQFGAIVVVKAVHGRWAPRQLGFEVASREDESPSFDALGDERHLVVQLTPETSPASWSHTFEANLSCFWLLRGCGHPRQIIPLAWQEKVAIDTATLERLKSNDPCPDRILAGRVKYLLDIDVFLLESTGFETRSVSEEGLRMDEHWTHYKLIEVLRGRSPKAWEYIRGSSVVPYPGDYLQRLPNNGLQWANKGERVIAFGNLSFDSCRVVAATASALSTIRNATPAPRRTEDELVGGLM